MSWAFWSSDKLASGHRMMNARYIREISVSKKTQRTSVGTVEREGGFCEDTLISSAV